MSKTQFEQELGYHSVVSICNTLLKTGVIRISDFNKVEQFFCKKYNPIFQLK